MQVKGYLLFVVSISLILLAVNVFGPGEVIPQGEMYQLSLLGLSAQTLDEVHSFRLKVRLTTGDKIHMGFHDKDEKNEADDLAFVVRKTGDDEVRLTGDEAEVAINNLIRKLPHPTNTEPLALLESALKHLDVTQSDVREIELGMSLTSGEKIRLCLDVKVNHED